METTSKTVEMLEALKGVKFLSREQARQLTVLSLKEFTKRSRAAKEVERSYKNMILAGGCPNAVHNKVIALVSRYGYTVS